MKIGVSSYSFRKYQNHVGASFADLATKARELGYEGIEFLELDAKGGDPVEAAKALRAHCQSIDMPIIAYTVGADFLKGGLTETVAALKICVDTAQALGAPLMRHDVTIGEGQTDWREAVKTIAPAIREVTEYAAQRGVKTCTENHGYFMQDAYRVEALIRAVDHPNYRWLVDIGNFACVDENSIEAVSLAAPYAIHVHAKDFLIKPAAGEDPGMGWFRSRYGSYLRGTVVGHGAIPVRACMNILRDAGYTGWLSYEFEGMEDNIAALEAGLAYLKGIAG